MQLREALDVQLVDHRLVPRACERPVALPVEARVDDDALRDRGALVLVVAGARRPRSPGGYGSTRARVPGDRALDRLRVRVDQQLAGLKRWPASRARRARDAVAVALPGPDAREVAVPVERGALGQLDRGLARPRRRTGRARRVRRAPRRARSSCPHRPRSRRAGTAAQARCSASSSRARDESPACKQAVYRGSARLSPPGRARPRRAAAV